MSGSVLSLATPENGTYDIYTYGEEDTPTFHDPPDNVWLNTDNHGFGLPDSFGGFGICSAFHLRGGPFYGDFPFPPFFALSPVYGWLIGTRTDAASQVHELVLTGFSIFYFVGGQWNSNAFVGNDVLPQQGTEARFGGELSSRRVLVWLQTEYRTIVAGIGSSTRAARKEIFHAELPSPCRDFSGTLSLTSAADAIAGYETGGSSYTIATGGYLAAFGLEAPANYKSVQLVF